MITQQQKVLAKQLLTASKNDLVHAISVLKDLQVDKIKSPKRPNTEVIVEVNAVSKKYKTSGQTVNALSNVTLDIRQGEFVAITGTSGSGKSTLLHMIGGLDKPSSGKIIVAGQDIAKLHDGKLSNFRNKTIGFVFQFFYLQPFLPLQTNIEVPAMFSRTKKSERTERSQKLAETVGLSERLRHLPKELSGGQMQRVAIARALQNQPRILLADEPTGNLDRTNALAIFELFRNICTKNGTTIIIITHDQELANHADRIINMVDGTVLS